MWRWFDDITRNQATRHVVALDLFKALSFFAGLLYFLVLVPVVVVCTTTHIVLPAEPGFFLVANGFGLQALKVGAKYLQRKTADADGPLVAPCVETPVPAALE